MTKENPQPCENKFDSFKDLRQEGIRTRDLMQRLKNEEKDLQEREARIIHEAKSQLLDELEVIKDKLEDDIDAVMECDCEEDNDCAFHIAWMNLTIFISSQREKMK